MSKILRRGGYALGAVVLTSPRSTALPINTSTSSRLPPIRHPHGYTPISRLARVWRRASRIRRCPEGIDGKGIVPLQLGGRVTLSLASWARRTIRCRSTTTTRWSRYVRWPRCCPTLSTTSSPPAARHLQLSHYGPNTHIPSASTRFCSAASLNVQDALGYTLVRQFIEHPRFGPWTDTEAGADQNFNEYDHAPVLVFKNTGNLSADAITNVLTNNGRIQDPSSARSPL